MWRRRRSWGSGRGRGVRDSRIANIGTVLKPQDLLVVLKIVASGRERAPYAQLAQELSMSAAEVRACVKRSAACRLLHRPNRMAPEEFGDEPVPVWPSGEGSARGVALTPLFKTAQEAVPRDGRFYELLALTDSLRGGQARERLER